MDPIIRRTAYLVPVASVPGPLGRR
jgi:hypothetical protein